MLLQVLGEGVDVLFVLLGQFLLLLVEIIFGLLLSLRQLLFELQLNVQQLIDHLGVQLLKVLVRYLIESVNLVGVVRVDFGLLVPIAVPLLLIAIGVVFTAWLLLHYIVNFV